MGPEILGALATVIVGLTGGIGWLQERSNKRIDMILDKSNRRIDVVLVHIQTVERTLNDMRADLPVRYTLREDHIRLAEKVDNLANEMHVWKHTETTQ